MAEKKADIRRKQILKDLMEHESVAYSELMERYGISERCMQMDIRELIKQGYEIKGVKAAQGYVLRNREKEQVAAADGGVFYQPANTQNIRKLMILLLVQRDEKGCSREEISAGLKGFSDGTTSLPDEKTIDTCLEEMKEQRLLTRRDGRYFPSVNAPAQLDLELDQAFEILSRLEYQRKGHPYEETLDRVRRKLALNLFNDPTEDPQPAADYVVYRRSYSTAGRLEGYLTELNRLPYEAYMLSITYQGRKGRPRQFPFMVGQVLYSVDKDRLYLLGRGRENFATVLYYPAILSMEVYRDEKGQMVPNDIYQSRYYTGLTEDMFSLSCDPAKEVEVEFQNIFQIRSKLEKLVQNRKNASLTLEGDRLIYRDRISGLEDFAGYLRRFGYACRVKAPEELKNRMADSARHILDAYARLEEDL